MWQNKLVTSQLLGKKTEEEGYVRQWTLPVTGFLKEGTVKNQTVASFYLSKAITQ